MADSVAKLKELGPTIGHHEHVYPLSDGIGGVTGAPVTVSTNQEDDTTAPGTDQWYYGAPVVLLPTSISGFGTPWRWFGLHIYGTTTAKEVQFQAFKILLNHVSTLDTAGATPAEGTTSLTVADGTVFATGDLIWITSATYPSGEIQVISDVSTNVLTFGREGDQNAMTGLRWPHNDLTTTKFYVVHRDAVVDLHTHQFEFSVSSAKDFETLHWAQAISMPANSGVIIRALNQSDGVTASVDMKLIWEGGVH
ncbi:hypothetical protein LCGC14_1852380 [marine sediment metagenome]|uniref:Uncharacterized protein n=1 Tax=marine sediment metagenome TaxID=412755 RepID=A0A0F9GA83_9ZZZZ